MAQLSFFLAVILCIGCNAIQAQKLLFTEPKLLPESINSGSDADFPMFAPDGSFIFFSRSNDSLNKGGLEDINDIWFSYYNKNNDSWNKAFNSFPTLNNAFENAVVGISSNAKRLYLHNTYLPANPSKVSICYSDYLDTGWSQPSLLEVGSVKVGDKPYGVFMYTNEKVLFVSMEGNDGEGSEDIYVVFKDAKGKWSKPINLGPQINSKGYDFSPFLDHTGENLFFATDGRGGEGGTDIFVSKRLDSTWKNWSAPLNLGNKINTPGDEIYFTMTNQNLAFFSSKPKDQVSRFYQTSIYFLDSSTLAKMPEAVVLQLDSSTPVFMLISRIAYKGADNQPAANVEVLLLDDLGNLIEKSFSNEDGVAVFKNIPSNRSYKVKAYAPTSELTVENFTEPILDLMSSQTFTQVKPGESFSTPNHSKQQLSILAQLKWKGIDSPIGLRQVEIIGEDNSVLQRSFCDASGKVLFRNLKPNTTYRINSVGADSMHIILSLLDPVFQSVDKAVSSVRSNVITHTGAESTFTLIARLSRKNSKTGFPSIETTLSSEDGTLLARATTDEKGYLIFKNLPSNNSYRIQATTSEADLAYDVYTTEDVLPWKNEKVKRLNSGETFSVQGDKGKTLTYLARIQRLSQTNYPYPSEILLETADGTQLVRIFSDRDGVFQLRELQPDKQYKLTSTDSEPVFFMLAFEEPGVDKKGKDISKEIGWGVLRIKKDGISGQRVTIKDFEGRVISSGICSIEGFVRLRNIPSNGRFVVSTETEVLPKEEYEMVDYEVLKKISLPEKQKKAMYMGSTSLAQFGVKNPLHVYCKLTSGEDSSPVANVSIALVEPGGEIISKGKTNQNGEIRFLSLDPAREYSVVLDETQPMINLTLSYFDGNTPLKAGDKGSVRPHSGSLFTEKFLFDHNKHDINDKLNQSTINKIKEYLEYYPSVRLTILGHTDQSGKESYNQMLSLKRANAIKYYLTTKFNLDQKRISVDGMGDKYPVVSASNTDDLRILANRRVELVVKGY